MTILTCDQVREQIDLHALGESSHSDADMDRHLEQCPTCRQEFEQVQELMAQLDWHHREPAALERLLTSIEAKPKRKPVGWQPWIRRGAALAASLFILSLLSVLYPTITPPATTDSTTTIVVWLEPTAEQRGDPKVPAPEHLKLAHGTMAEIAMRSKTEPATPSPVNLSLALANSEKQTIYLHPEDAETSLQLDLNGPDVRRDSARGPKTTPSLTPLQTTLKPGATTSLPLRALIDGTRSEPSYLSCVGSGTYTLTIRYRVRVSYSPNDPGTWRIFSTQAITLQVGPP